MSSDTEVDRYRCPYCSAKPYTSTKERKFGSTSRNARMATTVVGKASRR